MDNRQIPVIIPARGGSKGVPGKNIKKLAGKPLLAHSIEQAKGAESIGDVFVSTDDEKIAEVAYDYGAEVISRPTELSDDSASSEAALHHALRYISTNYGKPSLVGFLQCTSPIRTAEDIEGAVATVIQKEADSLLSVVPNHRFVWADGPDGPRSLNFDYTNRPRRQDMEPQYVENGSIYIFKPWVLEEYDNRLGGKVALYVMEEHATFEIDTPFDFKLVEFVMQDKGLA